VRSLGVTPTEHKSRVENVPDRLGLQANGETPEADEERVPPRASQNLRDEHVHVLRMLKVLEWMRPLLAAGDYPPSEDWSDIVNFLRVFVDRCHHGKEERLLFSALRQVADDQTRTLIEELIVDHVEGRRLVAALAYAAGIEPALPGSPGRERELDPAAADQAIVDYVALIRPHVVAEEERLFPLADRSLAPEIQQTLEEEYRLIEQEVIGTGAHDTFEQTVERLRARYARRRQP